MAEHLVELATTPDEIGNTVAKDFKNGDTHVLIHGAQLYKEKFLTKYNNNREESSDTEAYYKGYPDKPQQTRQYLRHKVMLAACEKIAQFETDKDGETIDPLRTLEVFGRRGALLDSEKATTFHTEEASDPSPSRIVSYWDAQPAGGKGEKIHLLSVTDIVKWTTESPDNRAFFSTLREPQEFYHQGRFKAPIYDAKAQTIRYHERFKDSTASKGRAKDDTLVPLTKIEAFFKQAFEDGLGETIQMQPGSILFIDNHKAAHAVEFEVNQRRMTYKLLLAAFKADIIAAQVARQEAFEKAS